MYACIFRYGHLHSLTQRIDLFVIYLFSGMVLIDYHLLIGIPREKKKHVPVQMVLQRFPKMD